MLIDFVACTHCLAHCLQGGLLIIGASHLDEVNAATAKFSSEVTDPKAQIISGYNFLLGAVCLIAYIS
jgi:hypothetical protein